MTPNGSQELHYCYKTFYNLEVYSIKECRRVPILVNLCQLLLLPEFSMELRTKTKHLFSLGVRG